MDYNAEKCATSSTKQGKNCDQMIKNKAEAAAMREWESVGRYKIGCRKEGEKKTVTQDCSGR